MAVFSKNGYSCELDFLTNIPTLNNNLNRDTIWNQLQGSIEISDKLDENGDYVYNLSEHQKNPTRVTVFKGNKDGKLVNYYKDKIYTNPTINPYLKLMKDFEVNGFESVRLEAADFAYLTKLGVYPLNRLWVLRRFKEGDAVPDNLLDWSTPPYPISTVVGWIPPEDNSFFGVDFNETWMTQNSRVDQVLADILEKEFGFKSSSVLSVPGWSQGLLHSFLSAMGISNFSHDEIPFGNPNVLGEAATRVTDPTNTTYGLKSNMTVSLKTGYEQKFIGDIDPGSAMLDIIRNLTRMGTSDVVYFASKNAEIFTKLRTAAAAGNNVDLWWDFIKTLLNKFIEAINTLFDTMKDKVVKAVSNTSGTKIVEEALTTIAASTIAKWKWPLKGGLGVMTGENTTPWHLTIGNPYSPFVSLGNVIVEKVSVDWNNEIGFNDIPTRIDVDIKVSLGRNLGGQEIFSMFNNGYTRVYDINSKTQMSLAKLYKTKTSEDNKTGVEENKTVSTTK